MTPVDVLLVVAAVPALLIALYLALLAVFSWRLGTRDAANSVWFEIVIPAHNEEQAIGATLASLAQVNYPSRFYRVTVVADNCTDATEQVAGDLGARVLVRNDERQRGKGYALAFAFAQIEADGWADAVVVVDADSVVSKGFLSALSARFEAGADCVQAEYAVRNAVSSWRTRLMAIAFALYHGVRSTGRERLALSCGLRGNGMAFRRSVLDRVPYRAFSVVEDVEYGLVLGLHGVRVAYEPNAVVYGDMPTSGPAAATQRQRWEDGRNALRKTYIGALLRRGWGERCFMPVELAVDLATPALTTICAIVAGGVTAAVLSSVAGVASTSSVYVWLSALALILLYVARGVVISGMGIRGVASLFWAPVFAIWKLTVALRPSAANRGEWVRTARSPASDASK